MRHLNPLANDKYLDRSKLKTFAVDTVSIIVAKLEFVLGRVENIAKKGENFGIHNFLLFPQCFQKLSFFRVVKSQDCVVKVKGTTLI